jgi:hypothetical protein
MNEAAWLTATDPLPMLAFLKEEGWHDHRKLCLFACACVRRVWTLLTDPRSRDGVEARELYLGGLLDSKEATRALAAARSARREAGGRKSLAPESGTGWAASAASAASVGLYTFASDDAASAAACVGDAGSWFAGYDAERRVQAGLLRDLFGNPFRTTPRVKTAVLQWSEGTVVRIARGIYEEPAFERMGVLADALLDAGCDSGDVLSHCRQEGGHVRGCWVLDLLLSRE